MMSDLKTKNDVLDFITACERAGILSVTNDMVAKALHVSRPICLKAMNALIIERRIEYARKNPRSAQARFQLAAEGFRR